MSEDKKIEALIQQYKFIFDTTNADVCHTIKGVWFFYRYNEKYENYECFIRFKTADELKQIIIGEMVSDVNLGIELMADSIVENYNYTNEDISGLGSLEGYQIAINKLVSNLDIVCSKFEVMENTLRGLQVLVKEQSK